MKTKQIILIAFAAILFIGCKPIKEIQYIDRYHETIKTDSVYKFEKDTMFLDKKGDTIFVTQIKTKIDYKFKYINKTDTVTKMLIKEKEVPIIKEKKVTQWISWIDWIIIGLTFLGGLYWILKKIKVMP